MKTIIILLLLSLSLQAKTFIVPAVDDRETINLAYVYSQSVIKVIDTINEYQFYSTKDSVNAVIGDKIIYTYCTVFNEVTSSLLVFTYIDSLYSESYMSSAVLSCKSGDIKETANFFVSTKEYLK